MYRKLVRLFHAKRYNISESIFTSVSSFDGLFYICITCDSKVIKGKTPCQTVYNKLQVENLPQQFDSIRRLERVLISKRIRFKKITIMPKGQPPKMKGVVCNVPIENEDVSSLLPKSRIVMES